MILTNNINNSVLSGYQDKDNGILYFGASAVPIYTAPEYIECSQGVLFVPIVFPPVPSPTPAETPFPTITPTRTLTPTPTPTQTPTNLPILVQGCTTNTIYVYKPDNENIQGNYTLGTIYDQVNDVNYNAYINNNNPAVFILLDPIGTGTSFNFLMSSPDLSYNISTGDPGNGEYLYINTPILFYNNQNNTLGCVQSAGWSADPIFMPVQQIQLTPIGEGTLPEIILL